MRRWGVLISIVYAVLLYLLYTPLFSYLVGDSVTWAWDLTGFSWEWDLDDENVVGLAFVALILGLLVAQAVLFTSVDRSFRKPIPRASLKRTVWATAFATGLLTAGFLSSLVIVIQVAWDFAPGMDVSVLVWFAWIPAWLVWGLAFNRYVKDETSFFHKMISRLLAGSLLELLVAVPCHVYIRRSGECSAPLVTGWGIVTGIAVMLLALGPGVLLLYRKKLLQYEKPAAD